MEINDAQMRKHVIQTRYNWSSVCVIVSLFSFDLVWFASDILESFSICLICNSWMVMSPFVSPESPECRENWYFCSVSDSLRQFVQYSPMKLWKISQDAVYSVVGAILSANVFLASIISYNMKKTIVKEHSISILLLCCNRSSCSM